MRQQIRAWLVFGIFALGVSSLVYGIAKENHKKEEPSPVNLLHADKLYFDVRINPLAQFLVGNVQFEHDGAYMYCDSALFYKQTNSFDAFGHVRMVQGDTLSLTGETLFYDGDEQVRRARVRNNVVLKHRNSTLYTDSLDYDRIEGKGYFFDGGRLVDEENQLTSEWGEYMPSTREAVFNYNVLLQNPRPPHPVKTTLITDTLHYNTRTGVAIVYGPSNIDNAENHIYTERGIYDTKNKEAFLLNRSILQNGYRALEGDSIYWNEQERVGKVFGDAYYKDTLNKNIFLGNYVLYNDSTGYAEAADSALLIDYSQKDTLYAHADSFFLYTYNINTDSVYRDMRAYHRVRVYRKDIQAVCDSLVYHGKDSCGIMYKDPIVWQEGQQLLGEEIRAWHNDSTIDSAYVMRQALSVERLDDKNYNQIASNEIRTYFKDGEIHLMVADRNVYVNFFPFDDDSLMIGMNHVESSEMKMWMKNRKVSRIWMPQATGTMYPVMQVPADVLYLENFAWFDYVRPAYPEDVFNWRPKQQGTELKPIVRNKAPRQTLEEIKEGKKK